MNDSDFNLLDDLDMDLGSFDTVDEFDSDGLGIKWHPVQSPKKTAAAIIGGIIGCFGGITLYNILISNNIYRPLSVALFFLILSVCTYACVLIASYNKEEYYRFNKGMAKSENRRNVALLFVLIFVVSGIFEILYEIDSAAVSPYPTSYIFALDTSGSVEGEKEIIEDAFSQVVSKIDPGFPFAVYTFSNEPHLESAMHNKTDYDNSVDWNFDFGGGTAFFGALNKMISDLDDSAKNQTISGGDCPRVIIFSDGEPGDAGIFGSNENDTIKKYRERGISICTVGVRNLSGEYERLMSNLAASTGGVMLTLDNMNELYTVMNSALTIQGDTTRTLISHRPYMRNGSIYAALRILFLLILGMSFYLVLYYANCVEYDSGIIFVAKLLTSVLGALLMEFGMQSSNTTSFFVQLLFSVLMAAAILSTLVEQQAPNFESDGFTVSITDNITPNLKKEQDQNVLL